jgi:two-component system sensor histidine kinase KdpD
VLAQSPEIMANDRLAGLVRVQREEGERLNEDIQNLLDATRISNEGVRPRVEWVDPEDIVSAAVAHKRRLLGAHRLKIAIAEDLPMLEIDPMLVEKAFGQFIENAAKYSAAGSEIEIAATSANNAVTLAVKDHGDGLTADEQKHIWERFYRSPRHATRPGSGLGLWIARALIDACGGRVEALSPGVGEGATFLLHLPASRADRARPVGDADA